MPNVNKVKSNGPLSIIELQRRGISRRGRKFARLQIMSDLNALSNLMSLYQQRKNNEEKYNRTPFMESEKAILAVFLIHVCLEM